jgi:hypothetical protein
MDLAAAVRDLQSSDYHVVIDAVRRIHGVIGAADDVVTLSHVREAFDAVYEESSDSIRIPEILSLREAYATRVAELKVADPEARMVLARYVADTTPDTYPRPDFSQQGPEWTAPCKWKVRMASALALSIVGGEEDLQLLQNVQRSERVEPVRRLLSDAIERLRRR